MKTREEIKAQAERGIERARISVNAVNAIFEAMFEPPNDDDPLTEYRNEEINSMRRRR